jgi:YesN/AraC family two-component response regulator
MINRIEYYIREHLGEPLTTQQICSVFQISGSHLTQMFRHFVKMSFVEYVTQLRIDEAKRLMAETPGIPVKDVAALLGFSDQFYFSKVFKSVTGVPPSEYRIAKD